MAAAAGGAPPPPAPAAQAPGLEENLACALCYLLWILTGILFLVLEPYNRNRTIRFHAFQSIFAGVAVIVVWIAIGIFGALPFVGWTMYVVLMPILGLAVFVLWLLLMYKAYNREKLVLPFIGPLAEKQA